MAPSVPSSLSLFSSASPAPTLTASGGSASRTSPLSMSAPLIVGRFCSPRLRAPMAGANVPALTWLLASLPPPSLSSSWITSPIPSPSPTTGLAPLKMSLPARRCPAVLCSVRLPPPKVTPPTPAVLSPLFWELLSPALPPPSL